MRVGVLVLLLAEEPAAGAQRLDDVRVGLDHVAAGERHDALVEGAVELHRVLHGHAVALAEPEVVLAERERRVHDARAVLGGHEVGLQHRLRARSEVGDVGERGLVRGARQLRALHPRLHLRALAKHALEQRLGDYQALVAEPCPHVRHIRVHRQGGVRQQGPRRGGPAEEGHPGLVAQREAHVHGRVHDVAVAQRHLVRGQRRAAARAVGHDLVALVEQVLLPDLLERPPDRLDVLVVVGHIGVVHVDPEADPLGEPGELVHVLEHRLAAALVELRHAVGLDVVLRLDAQLALHLELDRQAVGVPARLAVDLVAAHGLVAREDVLEDPREHVVGARPPVCGRRTLVEDELRAALAPADRLVEDVALAPALEHALLERGEGGVLVDGPVGAHPASIL